MYGLIRGEIFRELQNVVLMVGGEVKMMRETK